MPTVIGLLVAAYLIFQQITTGVPFMGGFFDYVVFAFVLVAL